MAISPDKIHVREKFQHKITTLTKRVEDLFEYDVHNGIVDVSAITGIVSSTDELNPKVLYRCKTHKIPCFTTQVYWNDVNCLTKICDTASEHVAWIKNRPEAYGPSYDIEEYELIESLREVDNYDPFDIIRSESRNFGFDDEDESIHSLYPCRECLRMLYHKIPEPIVQTMSSDAKRFRGILIPDLPGLGLETAGAAAGAGGGK
jgi:hypothetical protein